MCRNHTKNNISYGPSMQVRSTIGPLAFNIANMRLAQHKIGTEAWWRSFWLQMTALGYRELEGLLSAPEGASQLRAAIETKGHLSTTRVKRASAKLLECPSQDVSFVTVITDIARTKEEALALLKSTGDQLDRFIRRRFPKAIWLMIPEVDTLLADDIADGLVVHSGWRTGLRGDRRVYKVHFHGMIYVPGMTQKQVERAFRFGRSGKRLKRYSGHNQVRAKEMNADANGAPDVEGIKGYATKCHYRPPVKSRMLEGAAEWVWLTYHILSDDKLIKIGGVNGHRVVAEAQTAPCEIHNDAIANSDFEYGTCSSTALSESLMGMSVSNTFVKVPALESIKYLNSDPVSTSKIYDIRGKVKKIRRPGSRLHSMQERRRTPCNPAAP